MLSQAKMQLFKKSQNLLRNEQTSREICRRILVTDSHTRMGGRGGGGGTPLYKTYRYVPPHWVWFLRRFGLKAGIHFDHFGLESGMIFEETTRLHERFYRFNSK